MDSSDRNEFSINKIRIILVIKRNIVLNLRSRKLKTHILILVLIALSVTSLLAEEAKQVQLGLKFGANVSKLTGNYALHDNGNNHSRNRFYPGFNSGLFVGIPMNNYNLQLEATYRQKSLYYSQDPDLAGGSWNGKVRFNYLELPLLYRHNFPNKRKQYFSLVQP